MPPAPEAAAPPAAGPLVDAEGVTFRVPDPDRALHAVIVHQEVAHPRSGPELERSAGGCWTGRLERPPVDRMEYLLETLHPDGRSEIGPDPANPRLAPGPFGPKSVIEFPGYAAPPWVAATDEPPARGTVLDTAYDGPGLGAAMPVKLWAAPGTGAAQPLPLLVVHDGIEYDTFSGLLDMLDRLAADRTLPPLRAALLHPVARDEHYSASDGYAEVLARGVLPWLHDLAPTPGGRRHRVGMGASLGALAMLHAHRTQPPAFGGLFLQSGSFFHHRYDRYDMSWGHFERVRRFMDRVHADREWDQPIPLAMTCGTVEMNLANNRATGLALRRQGYDVDFRRVRDAHNWVGWRDAWTPGLVDLLRRLWT